ncbi:DUF3461 family protein [Thiolinea disciformis]|uniref:DUF3461 family protein n=1 Tax=Thiolinea disciformis TaxID=125614 RepID=UPI0003672AB3|nr:DUF3461 family protein [Thiolinea disciformis]
MTTSYPHLAQMGVQNPQQIIGYTLSHVAPDTDILKIKYQRPKGSFLPVTRSYQMGRSAHTRIVDSGTNKTEEIYEISPLLTKAVVELDSIVDAHSSQSEVKQKLLAEINRVQVEFNAELNALKQLVQQLDSISNQ